MTEPLQRDGRWAVLDGREYEVQPSRSGVWHLASWDPSDAGRGFQQADGRRFWTRDIRSGSDVDGFFRIGYVGRYRGEEVEAVVLGDRVSVELVTNDQARADRLGMDYSFSFNQYVKKLAIDDPELTLQQTRTSATAPLGESGMTLQLAVMPARERAWLTLGLEAVCGYAVRTEDVAWADTPAKLHDVHGLGFLGSPLRRDASFLDVLRIPESPFVRAIPAVGGRTRAGAEAMGGAFVDRAPFTGTGFAPTSETVPLWWVDPAKVPAGSRLVRVHADGHQDVVAVYVHIGRGWVPTADYAVPRTSWLPPSETLGIYAHWHGERHLADVLEDGSVIVCSTKPQDGMTPSERGVWWVEVPRLEVTDLIGLRVTGTWRSLPFQVLRTGGSAQGTLAELVYIGHDADAAEAAGLAKTDAGVYEAVAPWNELREVQGVETSVATA